MEDKSKETFQKLEQKEVGKGVRNSEKKIRVIHESPRRPQIYKLEFQKARKENYQRCQTGKRPRIGGCERPGWRGSQTPCTTEERFSYKVMRNFRTSVSRDPKCFQRRQTSHEGLRVSRAWDLLTATPRPRPQREMAPTQILNKNDFQSRITYTTNLSSH